jgi:septal ring factor EnvC (AmiA/AmiB activator)
VTTRPAAARGGKPSPRMAGRRAAALAVAALAAVAVLAAAVALAAAAAAPAPAPPQPTSPGSPGSPGASGAPGAPAPVVTAQTRAREQELAALRAEISGLEARLEAARRQQSGATGELAAADLALQLEEKRLAEAVVARDEAAEREAVSERQVVVLERALDQRRRAFQRQLTGLYRLGRQGYLRLFFLLRPDASLLPSIRLMRYLVRRDREAIDAYQEAKQRLARRRDQLAAERQERDRWLGWEQTRRRELVAARQRKATLLARVERERQVLAGRAVELADRERKLAAFLDLLYGRSSTDLAGAPMQQFRGILDWPVAGRVVERFGPRLDPRYRTQVPHNGIDLETAAGAEVKAVYPGKVLFAAPFEGYGLTVVVHHPGRVLTLYAGLAELKKTKDDMVSLAETVGLASDRLYFEIRVENHPEDPVSWLH